MTPLLAHGAPERAVHRWLTEAIRASGSPLVALAVGDSTLPLYRDLPWDPAWADKRILPVDELIPAPRDPRASFGVRLAAALPPAFRHLVRPAPRDPDDFARVLRTGLCAVVLGLGPDGHVAFNQPGSGIDARARTVALRRENLARLRGVEPATHAVTIGIGDILAAERVLLVAGGRGKERALARVLEGPEGADVPASWLRRHPDLTVVVSGVPLPSGLLARARTGT